MKLNKLFTFGALATFAFALNSCDKTEVYPTTIPEPLAHFVGPKVQNVLVDVDPAPSYNVIVGTTDVQSADRTVTYNITSPSGAVAGTDYTIASGSPTGTVTIPAGGALANITVQPNAASYGLDDRDTLIIYLSTPAVNPARFLDTVYLILRGPSSSTCDEGNPSNISDLLGDYDNTIERIDGGSAYGPYTTTVTAAAVTGPTSARVAISNLYDTGWGNIQFDLDWSDPTALTAIVVAGDVPNSDAGDLSATYAGQVVAVRPHSNGAVGTYSYCSETFNLVFQLGVSGLGFFGNVFTEDLAR